MKYFLFLLTAVILFNASTAAQKKHHKIVFDISGGDTADHNIVIRQVNNVLKATPTS